MYQVGTLTTQKETIMATSKKDVLTDAIDNYAKKYLKFCTAWEQGLLDDMNTIVEDTVSSLMSDMTFDTDDKGQAEKSETKRALSDGLRMGAILKVCNEMKHPIPLLSDYYKAAEKKAYKVIGVEKATKTKTKKTKDRTDLSKAMFG